MMCVMDKSSTSSMRLEIRLTAVLVSMATLLTATSSEMFTSSMKVERMVLEEEHVLTELKKYIDVQFERLKAFSNFYIDRLREARLRQDSEVTRELKHPNAVYNVIKRFALDYSNALGENFESFRQTASLSFEHYLADKKDVHGAQKSLLRLQDVYNISAIDMAKGDYLGFLGPQLSYVDAYEIGQTAFTEGKLGQSIDWLNTSLALYANKELPYRGTFLEGPTEGAIKGLMGRVYQFMGKGDLAQAVYDEAIKLDPTNGDIQSLKQELISPPSFTSIPPHDYFQNFSHLCSLENKLHPSDFTDPRIACRYREAVLPYYRFKEEILSVAPFASVIYNFLSNRENQHMKNRVRNKLKRGRVGQGEAATVSDIRTSDLYWIWDRDSKIASSLSKRIECITGLDTSQRLPDGPSSAEAFQVVNYGLGGHYEAHMDPLEEPSEQVELKHSGERIATFLIYLSDVQRGGSTVFTRAGMSVAPVKNMALLWYNYDTAHQRDELTQHAGCPVLIGEKWIANKWIWTYGNTFRRRCGLSPNTTQLDIEEDTKHWNK